MLFYSRASNQARVLSYTIAPRTTIPIVYFVANRYETTKSYKMIEIFPIY